MDFKIENKKSNFASLQETKNLILNCDNYFRSLLGYSVTETNLLNLDEKNFNKLKHESKLPKNIKGLYIPRLDLALINNHDTLSIFHEYFGHGLFFEHTIVGRRIKSLEKELMKIEKDCLIKNKCDLLEFKRNNLNYKELVSLKEKFLSKIESVAVFIEYLLSKENGMDDLFYKKYSLNNPLSKEEENLISLNQIYGPLTVFYSNSFSKINTNNQIKNLIKELFEEKKLNKTKIILLTGSKKPFSDIDLFSSSDYLSSINNGWLDLVNFEELDFERRIKLFEIQVTHPILRGELIWGDKIYLERKRNQLMHQPITKEAIEHNFKLSIEHQRFCKSLDSNLKQYKLSEGYSKSYLDNYHALKEGLRTSLTYEN